MFKGKKIKFFSSKTHLEIPRPFPTSKAMPEWYRKMPRTEEKIMTVKPLSLIHI